MLIPSVCNVALESFIVYSTSSIFSAKNLALSNGRSSIFACNSLGRPMEWSQEALRIIIAVAVVLAAVLATSREAWRAVLAISCPSFIIDLNCSFLLSGKSLFSHL